MTLEKALCESIKNELKKSSALAAVPVIASYDLEKLGSIQVVVDVSGAIAHAPGTNLPFFRLPVEIVIMSDRHDDPDKSRLRQIYQVVFDFMTATDLPADFQPPGMHVSACIPDPSQDGPDADENYNLLTYKSTFFIERT